MRSSLVIFAMLFVSVNTVPLSALGQEPTAIPTETPSVVATPSQTPTAVPTAKPTKTPTPKPFKGCKKGTPTGGMGFTYKANAAHFRWALAILPSSFVQNWTSVGVYTVRGKLINGMRMKGDGVCLPGMTECVRRPSFLGTQSGQEYQTKYKQIVIKAWKRKPKQCWYWLIKKPSVRVPLHH